MVNGESIPGGGVCIRGRRRRRPWVRQLSTEKRERREGRGEGQGREGLSMRSEGEIENEWMLARVNIANIIKEKKGSTSTMMAIIVYGVNGVQRRLLLSSLLSLLLLLMLVVVVVVVERGQCVLPWVLCPFCRSISVLLMPLYRLSF